jgi:hypothetical protein
MSAMHFHAWRSGLKTGQYYFRSRPARDAIKFTVNCEMLLQASDKGSADQVMECLNTENTKKNLGKRRAVGAKPASLEIDNMKKPIASMSAAADNQPATAEQKPEDNGDSSDVDLDCLACGS